MMDDVSGRLALPQSPGKAWQPFALRPDAAYSQDDSPRAAAFIAVAVQPSKRKGGEGRSNRRYRLWPAPLSVPTDTNAGVFAI